MATFPIVCEVAKLFLQFVAERNSLRQFQVDLSWYPHDFANKYDALDLTLITMGDPPGLRGDLPW